MRFDEKFNFLIEVDKSIDSSNTYIPNMIIQPFIENSIIHAFTTIKSGGVICLAIKRIEENIVIEIEDNGLGINNAKPNNKEGKHRSIGFSNVKSRLSLLPGTKLEVIDLLKVSKSGTLIRIITPIKTQP